jgi:hypothetical protein
VRNVLHGTEGQIAPAQNFPNMPRGFQPYTGPLAALDALQLLKLMHMHAAAGWRRTGRFRGFQSLTAAAPSPVPAEGVQGTGCLVHLWHQRASVHAPLAAVDG